jgi:hypothetical protein
LFLLHQLGNEQYQSLLKTTPHKLFPAAVLINDDHLLSPMHLSYDMLKECVALAHDNYVSGTWSIDNDKQYLYVHCLNKETVSAVLQHAVNSKNFKTLDGNKMENYAAYNICGKKSQCVDLGMYFFKLEIGESPSVCQKNQESGKILSNSG